MTIEDIFNTLRAHLKKGISIHEQMYEEYDFLRLDGYATCHRYHYFSELKGYNHLLHYYMNNYHKFIPNTENQLAQIIPASWYKYTQQEVDTSTKRGAVRDLMKQWVEWEKQTIQVLQSCYVELVGISEIGASIELANYIKDVEEELAEAEGNNIMLSAVDYDIVYIAEQQPSLIKEYNKKLQSLFKKDKEQ